MEDEISKVQKSKHQPVMKVSWEYYEHLVDKLYNMIPKNKYGNISGIPRGGLIPAVMLSHKLNLPLIDLEDIHKDTLVVDDICDTGITLSKIKGFDVATLFVRRTSTIKPKYSAESLFGDEWILFPYERDPKSVESQKPPCKTPATGDFE